MIDVDSLGSMNMWGLTPDFLGVLEEGFKAFFEKEVPGNPMKVEYLIPIFIGELLEQGKMSVKVLKTKDTWYGMTYHEDVAAVKGSFKEMLKDAIEAAKEELAALKTAAQQTNEQLVNGEITPHHTIARLVLLDFANYLIYYTCKKVTYELLTYEYNYWRRADESVLLP